MCPWCLNWALNEIKFGYSYKITIVSCSEKSQFSSNLTLNLDIRGYTNTILSNWDVSQAKLVVLGDIMYELKIYGGKV